MYAHETERRQEELEAAREIVRKLETELGQRHKSIGSVFKLPPSLVRVLDLLLMMPVVEPDLLYRHAGIGAKVTMHRLRKALAAWDLNVRSRRRTGYYLDVADKAKVRAMLEI
jgi:hypothetical protein